MIASLQRLALAGCAVSVSVTAACAGSGGSAAGQRTSGTTATPSTTITAPKSPGGPTRPSAPRTSPATRPSSNPAATEFNPPGDIPDNQVFVAFRVPNSRWQLSVPEGWARSTSAAGVTFTDHYNSVTMQVVRTGSAPSVASAAGHDVPRLRRSVSNFSHGTITQVQRQHGPAVLVTYFSDSAASPVTGKVVRDAVERYLFWHQGQELVLSLTGPRGADNVDPWRTITDAVTWR